MAQKGVSCFFTWCFNRLEKECVDRGLLVLAKWAHGHLQSVKKGDIGFLVNVDHDELIGVFEAEGPGRLNADPRFWGGKYPAQVKVHLLGELQRISSAASKLKKTLRLWEPRKGWKVPNKVRYGPEVTEKVLALFETSVLSQKHGPQPKESGVLPDITPPKGSKEIGVLTADLVAHVMLTDEEYDDNFETGVRTHPIPFFGDLERAEVITVGVNPSVGEFGDNRWPKDLPPSDLSTRLRNYFVLSGVPRHPWFKTWEKCLALLDRDYRKNAAHMDLSPRATIAMSCARDQERFEEMVREDLSWFGKFLPFLKSAKIVLIAGTVVTGHGPNIDIDDLLVEEAPLHDFQLVDRHELTPKPGRVACHTLVTPHFRLPVFFCSVSPSAKKNRGLLLERIRENREFLLRCLSVDR